MFEFAALTYGMIVSFVMASTGRNRRDARTNPPLLTLFGWTLMTFSATTGVGLLGYCGYHALVGAPVTI
jgi:choline-glycine betaine transporter